jgi:galactokinase
MRRMDVATGELKRKFTDLFGTNGQIRIIRAPGRVNLIGEHTDYNDGFVCPMAIEPQVAVACRKRDDGKVRLASTAFPGEFVEFSVKEKIERGQPAWGDYMRGVVAELIGDGVPPVGFDALYTNDLPVGGGLSSSAAIEVSTGLCVLTLAGKTMDRMELALLCQRAEHEFPRVPCGIMDQMIVSGAHSGHATLFDCRSMEKRYVPIDPADVRVLICNSMVRHQLTGGEYAERRQQCEQGVAYFRQDNPEIEALRDVTLDQLNAAKMELDDTIFRRCRHVVTENARCVEAAKALERKNYTRIGELMVQSHISLRDDYQVSVPELDFLVDEAMKVKGVYGARMTGGGFGGCIVAVCRPQAIEPLAQHLKTAYQAKFGIEAGIFATTATKGASVLE